MIDQNCPDYTNTPINPARPRYGYAPADPRATPVVSIITPYYNTGPVFLETAQSILQQSFQQWEWVIVNDGSTNVEAIETIEPFRSIDPRIKVVDQRNAGLAGARNTGIRATSAPFVFFLDSDDLLEPTAIEQLLWKVYADERLSFATAHMVGFGGQTYIWQNGFDTTYRFLEENMVSVMALARREVVEQAGMFDTRREIATEDYDFWLRCASKGFWGADIPRPLLWYRRRPMQANGDIRDRTEQYEVFRHEMRACYADLYRNGMPAPFVDPTTEIAFHPLPNKLEFANRLTRPDGGHRLLLVLPWLSMGGADVFNLHLIKQLTARGWQVSVCSTLPSDDDWIAEYTSLTPDVFSLSTFLHRPEYPRFLRYLIESRQIDTVLVSNSYFGYQLLPYLRAHHPDITYMDFIHMEEENWRSGGYPRASLNYAEQLDLTVVSSAHLKQWMTARGADPERVAVCTTNIDPDDWDPARYDRAALRSELAIDAEIPVILYAGRLSVQKQPRLFAEVMLHLARQTNSYVCLVAGDGPDRPWLEQFLHMHQLSNVRLLGVVSNQRMRELMALSDVFFLPSEMEGISLALYEAMAMGVVPVSADVGGQNELVTPDCGVLVPRGATERDAYIVALESLLRDPVRRGIMGHAGRQRICEHYRLDQMGEHMADLMAHAHRLADRAPRPTIPLGLGMASAIQAVEQTRLERLADQWWAEHHNANILALAHQSRVDQLEQDRAWWEAQAANWHAEAERCATIIAEQQAWIAELERGKVWWEEQAKNWQAEADARALQHEQFQRRSDLVQRTRSYVRRFVRSRR